MSTVVETRPNVTLYWATWVGLLALTVTMLLVDSTPIPRVVLVIVLLTAMLIKASLIGAHFMHLRFERALLAIVVAVALLVTGAILFALIAPDAVRIGRMVRP
jgi:caa(3)-type oxidase subunit IV